MSLSGREMYKSLRRPMDHTIIKDQKDSGQGVDDLSAEVNFSWTPDLEPPGAPKLQNEGSTVIMMIFGYYSFTRWIIDHELINGFCLFVRLVLGLCWLFGLPGRADFYFSPCKSE